MFHVGDLGSYLCQSRWAYLPVLTGAPENRPETYCSMGLHRAVWACMCALGPSHNWRWLQLMMLTNDSGFLSLQQDSVIRINTTPPPPHCASHPWSLSSVPYYHKALNQPGKVLKSAPAQLPPSCSCVCVCVCVCACVCVCSLHCKRVTGVSNVHISHAHRAPADMCHLYNSNLPSHIKSSSDFICCKTFWINGHQGWISMFLFFFPKRQ